MGDVAAFVRGDEGFKEAPDAIFAVDEALEPVPADQ